MTLPAVLPPEAPGLVPAAPVAAGPVTLRDELALWQEAFDFAKAIAPTNLVPKAFRNDPPAVMAVIIKGHELGVPALHALSQIHVIEGRPCVAAELQRALILSKGHELWTEDLTITRVTLCGRRRGTDHVGKVTWTMDDAKRAGLAGKPTWRAYPRAMLLARCSGELGRIMFADVLAGIGVNLEELTDGALDVLELAEDQAVEAKPAAAKSKRTRRTAKPAKTSAADAARPAADEGPQERPPAPGGPPPPLPGEEGYESEYAAGHASDAAMPSAPQSPATDAGPSPSPEPASGPAEGHPGPDPAEPEEVVTKRAQAIAMRAQRAGVDHHQVVSAITHGRATSAKDLNAVEAGAVLHALVDIEAGRARLEQTDEGGWDIVEATPDDEPAPPAGEENQDRTDEYHRRIQDLRRQQQEARSGGQQQLPDPDERSGP